MGETHGGTPVSTTVDGLEILNTTTVWDGAKTLQNPCKSGKSLLFINWWTIHSTTKVFFCWQLRGWSTNLWGGLVKGIFRKQKATFWRKLVVWGRDLLLTGYMVFSHVWFTTLNVLKKFAKGCPQWNHLTGFPVTRFFVAINNKENKKNNNVRTKCPCHPPTRWSLRFLQT